MVVILSGVEGLCVDKEGLRVVEVGVHNFNVLCTIDKINTQKVNAIEGIKLLFIFWAN